MVWETFVNTEVESYCIDMAVNTLFCDNGIIHSRVFSNIKRFLFQSPCGNGFCQSFIFLIKTIDSNFHVHDSK